MTLAPFLGSPIAHRALHDRAAGAIENSLTAIRAAIAHGYGIELDLQPSADGQAMVFHDEALDRLTPETGPISARTAQELGRIPLTGGPDTIPTLARVLAEVAGRTPVLLEIKDQDGALGPDIGPLERATARALDGYTGPVAIMSFNPHAVRDFAALRPDLPVGLTCDAFDPADWPEIPEARRARLAALDDLDGFDFISCGKTALDRPQVTALSIPVLTWTIRSPQEEAQARRIARNITFEGYLPPLT